MNNAKFIWVQELSNPSSTFDMAKMRCQKERIKVIVFRKAKGTGQPIPIMEFIPPNGVMYEIQADRLKTSMADVLIQQLLNTHADQTRRSQQSIQVVGGLLKQYEARGGTL